MGIQDDDELLERTMTSEVDAVVDPTGEIGALLEDLETLLKNGDVVGALSARNINASLALLALEGLRTYLSGKKNEAANDFASVAEEIRARLAVNAERGGGARK